MCYNHLRHPRSGPPYRYVGELGVRHSAGGAGAGRSRRPGTWPMRSSELRETDVGSAVDADAERDHEAPQRRGTLRVGEPGRGGLPKARSPDLSHPLQAAPRLIQPTSYRTPRAADAEADELRRPPHARSCLGLGHKGSCWGPDLSGVLVSVLSSLEVVHCPASHKQAKPWTKENPPQDPY